MVATAARVAMPAEALVVLHMAQPSFLSTWEVVGVRL